MWKPRVQLWLQIATNFLYYVGISPFKFKYRSDKSSYSCVSGLVHKLLSYTLHAIGVGQTVIDVYSRAWQINSQNPRCIFHSAVAYSRYVIYYTLIFTFWTKRSNFKEFFSFTAFHLTKPGNNRDNRNSSTIAWLLCIIAIPSAVTLEFLGGNSSFLHLVLAGIDGLIGTNLLGMMITLPPLPEPNPTMVTLSSPSPLLQETRQIIANATLDAHPPPPLLVMSSVEYAYLVLYDLVGLYVRVCNHLAMIFCLFAALTMNQAATTFMTSVQSEKDQEKVIQRYLDFCKFGDLLNKMCGCVTFGTVICSPPFLVVNIIGILNNYEIAGARTLVYTILYIVIYGIASDAVSKIVELKEWIIENGEGDNENQFFSTFVELSRSPMGLKGMGCFTISYGFVSNMLGAIITFIIILLQFETTPKSAITETACRT